MKFSCDAEEIVETAPAEQHFLECTAPFDDTVPVDGEFETQIVSPDEEPQAADCYAETQIINSQGGCMDNLETQLLDEFATQAIVDCESEETCRTELIGAGNYSSDDDSVSKSIGLSVDENNMQFSSPCGKGKIGHNGHNLSDEFDGSG